MHVYPNFEFSDIPQFSIRYASFQHHEKKMQPGDVRQIVMDTPGHFSYINYEDFLGNAAFSGVTDRTSQKLYLSTGKLTW